MVIQPEFFTQREFDLLKETEGKKKIKSDEHLSDAYKDLKKAYLKVEYWMNELQQRVFPNGKPSIRKKPTNQANNFDGYLWGKIYPTKEDHVSKWLAYTVGLDGSNYFNVKIDTVGIDDKDQLRKKYFKYRGDYFNSKIVYRYPFNSVNNWKELLDKSEEDLTDLIKYWQQIKSLEGEGMVSELTDHYKTNEKPPLNQIFYGPPGTGKTYATKAIAVEIANPRFSMDSNWDETTKRKAIVDEYERLHGLGQIVFTTFHQSMSYEDFIEGIKPETTPEGRIIYDIKKGVFKEFVKRLGLQIKVI